MSEQTPLTPEIDEFIQRELDGVPHLEALLLLWNSRPKAWSVEEMAAALYVDEGAARDVLQNLTRRHLAQRTDHDSFAYDLTSPDRDALVAALDLQYRRNLIRITRLIHAKASPGVREFADAFRFKKERE